MSECWLPWRIFGVNALFTVTMCTAISIFRWIEIHMIYVFRYRILFSRCCQELGTHWLIGFHLHANIFLMNELSWFVHRTIQYWTWWIRFVNNCSWMAGISTSNNGKHGKNVLRVIIRWIEYAVFRVTVRIHTLLHSLQLNIELNELIFEMDLIHFLFQKWHSIQNNVELSRWQLLNYQALAKLYPLMDFIKKKTEK